MEKLILISFVVLSFGFSKIESFRTAQYPDLIEFNGTEYSLSTNPLEPYFEKNPDKRPQWTSTALYRGYIGHFGIIDSTLILTDISQPRRVKEKDGKTIFKNISIKKSIFPEIDTIKIDWYSGILILPYGERIKYIHSGYASEYSNYILLEIKNGKFKRHKNYRHKEFLRFKEKQYSEFKKTETYKNQFEHIKNNYPESNKKFIEEFLKDHIINYTSEFLDEQ
ncbi:hypothetical protein ACFSKN_01675 [Mariniflexile gromovii]|uniref:Uncharacterized protein n=1 Tax=Mariniflexile gromovii TaxID=362523 RepID=A0ABS4BP37_9FLAO|nr:hypothetical protein [Mariniflexile gromovii]MBP0902311.1 hypothetical protein [Mariniflexile gromovii]